MEAHFATVFESIADATPDEVAVVQGPVRRTWRDFDDRAARLATAFAGVGVKAGSKVAQYLYSSPEYLESWFATIKGRAVPVNVNYRYLDDELAYLLSNSDAEVLLYHASLGDRVERIREKATAAGLKLLIEVDDSGGASAGQVKGAVAYDDVVGANAAAARIERSADDITMTYTGGTTGMPKGVMSKIGPPLIGYLSAVPAVLGLPPVPDPSGLAAAARQLSDEGRPGVALPACPLMHATGMAIGALPTLTFGGRIALLEGKGLPVDELWSLVDQEQVLSVTVVGDAFARPMLRELREGAPRDLSSVKVVLSSGAMFSTDIKAGLLEFMPGAAIIDYIGATEGLMGMSISVKDAPSPTGRFMPNPGVVVLTEDGAPVVAGSEERGLVHVPSPPEGYYKDAAKTAATFKEVGGIRYSVPGDWATVETDGSIVLLGRGSSCINTGGEKVFPEEVEEAVKLHPAVEDCLVFGVDDERFGQKVVAVASRAPSAGAAGAAGAAGDGAGPGADADAAGVIAFTKEKLSDYKVPRLVVFVDEVPRAANGKADYPAARKLFEASQT